MIGKTLGHYEITGQLGAGGMGDVYRAHDPKLQRDIAIKVLPEELAADPERRERFEREAVAVAALDHPNIVTVYSVEEADGLHFITMQLVEGKTLSALIPRQGFALEKFFELAVPLADAIGAAHERGITHRDLKPANVMVAADGRVKVLDFGLAKLMEEDSDAEAATELATKHLTEEGKILGTVAYMSPEQAEGKAVDHRSDIFSLGILMYQMITGEEPFGGDTKLSVMSSIVKDTPASVTELNPRVPRHLGRIIKQTLEKDLSRRSQSVIDVRNQLEDLRSEVDSGVVEPVAAGSAAHRGGLGNGAWLATGALVVVALLAGWAMWGRAPVEFTLGDYTSITLDRPGIELYPAVSPDGTRIAYSKVDDDGVERMYWKQSDGAGRENALTNDFEGGNESWPRWSPHGNEIAFVGGDGRAYRVAASGGQVSVLAEKPASDLSIRWVAWNPDPDRAGEIAYVAQDFNFVGRLFVQSSEGEVRELVGPDTGLPEELSTYQLGSLDWSPDGSRIAFATGNSEFYAYGNVADSSILVAFPDAAADPVLIAGGRFNHQSPQWVGDHLFFVSDISEQRDVHYVLVDAAGNAQGEVTRFSTGLEPYSISFDGEGSLMAYGTYRRIQNVSRIPMPAGETVSALDAEPITTGQQAVESLDVSADGTLVFDSDRSGDQDLWKMQLPNGQATRLTSDNGDNFATRFEPNGQRVVFHTNRNGARDIYVIGIDGTNETQLTFSSAEDLNPHWSPDGSYIIFQSDRGNGSDDDESPELWAIDVLPEGEFGDPRPFLPGVPAWNANLSADGRVAYFVGPNNLGVARPGSGEEPVTLNTGDIWAPGYPRWRDANNIMFTGGRPTGIYSTSADGIAGPRMLVEFPGAGDRVNSAMNYTFDDEYIYFAVAEFEGDVSVMEVSRSDR